MFKLNKFAYSNFDFPLKEVNDKKLNKDKVSIQLKNVADTEMHSRSIIRDTFQTHFKKSKRAEGANLKTAIVTASVTLLRPFYPSEFW